MNMTELKKYCEEKGIKKSAIDEFKAEGAKNANQIMKKIEEQKQILTKIDNLIDEAERMRSAYYFKPPRYANMRRRYEEKHSIDVFSWTDGADVYEAEFSVSCSCRNVYAKGCYSKNGKTTTLKAIKSSYARLKAKLYE